MNEKTDNSEATKESTDNKNSKQVDETAKTSAQSTNMDKNEENNQNEVGTKTTTASKPSSLGVDIKSPVFIGLAILTIILLIVVLVQSSTMSGLRSDNKALSARVLELEQELKESQDALAAIKEKEPGIFESVVGGVKQLAEDAKQALEDAKDSLSIEDLKSLEDNPDTGNNKN